MRSSARIAAFISYRRSRIVEVEAEDDDDDDDEDEDDDDEAEG